MLPLGEGDRVWNMDGIVETITQRFWTASFDFSMEAIENLNDRDTKGTSTGFSVPWADKRKIPTEINGPRSVLPKGGSTERSTAEISIWVIEILNCTFDPKPLYQRYIQVVVRAI